MARDHKQIIIANEGTTEYRVVPSDKPVAQLLLNRYAACDVVQTTVWTKQTARVGLVVATKT